MCLPQSKQPGWNVTPGFAPPVRSAPPSLRCNKRRLSLCFLRLPAKEGWTTEKALTRTQATENFMLRKLLLEWIQLQTCSEIMRPDRTFLSLGGNPGILLCSMYPCRGLFYFLDLSVNQKDSAADSLVSYIVNESNLRERFYMFLHKKYCIYFIMQNSPVPESCSLMTHSTQSTHFCFINDSFSSSCYFFQKKQQSLFCKKSFSFLIRSCQMSR